MNQPRKVGRSALAACAVLWGALAAPGLADDWPQWLGPNRDGISAETGWRADFGQTAPPTVWKTSVGLGFSSVSVAAGRLYTLGNTDDVDTLYCLDAATGRPIWKHAYPCPALIPKGLVRLYPGPRSTPTVDGGRVYSFSRAGELLCLDAADGKLHWSVDVRKEPIAAEIPTWGFACSPLVLGDRVILDAGPVVAFDKTTGKLLWKTPAHSPGYSSPVTLSLGGRQCLATFNGEGLLVATAADGREVLRHPFKLLLMENCVTPILSGDKCFISIGNTFGSAVVSLAGGKADKVWANSNMLNVFSNSVLWKGRLYGFHGSVISRGSLRCVDFATGEKDWSYRPLGKGALICADGKLIALTDDGELAIGHASPEGFTPMTRAQVLKGHCWANPVLAGGRIYCRNHAGDLICLDVSARPEQDKR